MISPYSSVSPEVYLGTMQEIDFTVYVFIRTNYVQDQMLSIVFSRLFMLY